jgi:endonuclease/exonuclease/phosphatase family metal-dependent hydrolase
MKIITLNTWGGKIYRELMDFVSKNKDADIFCFQEILKGGNGKTHRGEAKSCYEDIGNILTDHLGYFSEYGEGGYFSESSKTLDFKFGVACFVNKNHRQSFIEGVILYDVGRKWSDYDGRFAAGASLAVSVSDYVIVNVHGLWQGSMKKDSEARLEQSKKIINLANKVEGKKIICGDFNLEPQTESVKKLENLPMKNLIKEYKVTSTRTSLYAKDIRFADYMFTDNEIKVIDFQVLPDEVSDHNPLYLEFK